METAEIMQAIGRLLLGGLFVYAGLKHFPAVASISQAIAARGVPFARPTLLIGSLFQIVCGALLMLGLHTTWAALGLVLFTALASFMLLNFWDLEGEARAKTRQSFDVNIALIGGLLIAAANP